MRTKLPLIPVIGALFIMLFFVPVSVAFSATPSDAQKTVETAIEGKIDLNSAHEEQLITLPGIGPKMAANIIDYRKKNGPFKTAEDLLNVKGIGPKVLEKLKPHIEIL